jgi:flagellar biosynthesis protein FlhF
MQIKRFEAKNMTTALRMVKDELGPDAVILSARSLRKGRGFFGSMKYVGVEVTAAIDNGMMTPKPAPSFIHKERVPQLRRKIYGLANDIEEKEVGSSPTTITESLNGDDRLLKRMDSRGNFQALAALYRQMLRQEVDRGIASELVEEIKRIPGYEELLASGAIMPHLISILEEIGLTVGGATPPDNRQEIMAFIGPTGVGKTTTIAKLAAQHAVRQNRRVAMLTLDNYGIAAREHLNTYAKIIGVPMAIAVNGAELKRALKKFNQQEVILIDTPGINSQHQHQIIEMKDHFENTAGIETHLVLSATTKEKDLFEMVSKLKDFPVDRILFTKVDESSAFGNILNLLIHTKIPLSYFTNGRKVAEDIEPGTLPKLMDLIFQSGNLIGMSPLTCSDVNDHDLNTEPIEKTDEQPFIANKNSDVYHHLGCNWAKKIKPGHVVKFTSQKDAEFQNFLPCRSCNPDRIGSVQAIESRREKMNIFSYC